MVKICIVPGACPVIIRMFLIIHANENPVIRADLSKGSADSGLRMKTEEITHIIPCQAAKKIIQKMCSQ